MDKLTNNLKNIDIPTFQGGDFAFLTTLGFSPEFYL